MGTAAVFLFSSLFSSAAFLVSSSPLTTVFKAFLWETISSLVAVIVSKKVFILETRSWLVAVKVMRMLSSSASSVKLYFYAGLFLKPLYKYAKLSIRARIQAYIDIIYGETLTS